MDKKHTPEPWEIYGHAIHKGGECLAYLNGCSLENARRIVACVNACSGMNDPEKEIPALKKELVTPIMVQTNRLVDSVADLTAQRDELLAALKEVVYCSEHFGKAYAGRDARDKAKALIKRIDHA